MSFNHMLPSVYLKKSFNPYFVYFLNKLKQRRKELKKNKREIKKQRRNGRICATGHSNQKSLAQAKVISPKQYTYRHSHSSDVDIIVRNGVFKLMWDFQHTPSRQSIYISCVELEIKGLSVSGPIWDGTECPRKIARIGSNLTLILCQKWSF